MFRTVPIGQILHLPDSFPFLEERYSLCENLLQKGHYPPLPVWEEESGATGSLIWGRRILHSLTQASIPLVMTRIYTKEELDLEQAFRIRLELENRTDRWSWAELVSIYQFTRSQSIPLEKVSGVLFSDQNWHRLEKYSSLTKELQTLVGEGKIDLKTAEKVKVIPPSALVILAPLLDSITFSERRIFLCLFWEVIKRDNLSKADSEVFAKNLCSQANPLESLRRIRFPTQHRFEELYRTLVDPVIRGSGIRIVPPEYFEGSRFKVEFSFENSQHLNRKTAVLKNLSDRIDDLVKQLT